MNEYLQLKRSDFDHEFSIDTRWADMDALGHVNHAKFLTYLETARIEYYISFGFGNIRSEQTPSMILGGMEFYYLSQVNHPTKLTVYHRVNRVGKKSFDLLGAIFINGKETPVCTGLFKMISFDYKTQETVEIPREIKENLYEPKYR